MSTIKGGKKKRRGKNINTFAKPFVEPSQGQYFAKAIKPLGSLKVQLEVFFYKIKDEDKKKDIKDQRIEGFRSQEMIGHVRGSMRKREYVNPGDVVLVSEREFTSDSKVVDIVMKYPNNHHNLVKRHKYCPKDIMFNSNNNDDGVNFKFEDEDNDINDKNSSDEDLESSLNFVKTNTIKKKTGRHDNYLLGMDLPTFDDEFEDPVETAKQFDEFGNCI